MAGSLSGQFGHTLPEGAYEVKQYLRHQDGEVIELLAFSSLATGEVFYMGATVLGAQTPQGVVPVNIPFEIKDVGDPNEAFAKIPIAAQAAVDKLKRDVGAKIVQPKDVSPEVLKKIKEGMHAAEERKPKE